MPRRNRPRDARARRPARDDAPRGPGAGAPTRREAGPDGEWYVRPVPGERAVKTYRCPGCDHEVREGTPHVVAWPADESGSATDRRHWHSGCWRARHRRGPMRR